MVGTVNGNREYFEAAVRDLAMAEAQYPGWVARLLTHPVQGLDNYAQLIETLTSGGDVIKAFCEIAPFPNEDGRTAHLQRAVAAALMEKASELLAQPPSIQRVDVLADKLPNY